MNESLITDKQAIGIIVLFISGSTLMFGTAKAANEDIWLAIILSFLAGLLISMVYCKILTLFPGKNLFSICMLVFGKVIGSIFCFLYVFFSIHLASLVLVDYAEFMAIIALNNTPKLMSMLCIMFLILWVMKEGVVSFGMCCEFFVVVTFVMVFITFLLFIPYVDLNNLRPFLYKGVAPVLDATLDTFTFPFAETVLFMSIFSSFKIEKYPYRIYRIGLSIGALIIFISSVMYMLVLGAEEMLRLHFPPYTAFRIADIRNLFTRIEIVIGAGFLIGGFVKIVVCLLTCCKGICEMFSVSDYKIIVTPICILTIIMAMSDFNSIVELLEWDIDIWTWWALLYQVILPVIILIGSKIKVKRGCEKIKM